MIVLRVVFFCYFFFYEKPTLDRLVAGSDRGNKRTDIFFSFQSQKSLVRLKDCRAAGGAQIYIPRALSRSLFFFAFKHSQWFTRVIQAVSVLRLCIGIQLRGCTFLFIYVYVSFFFAFLKIIFPFGFCEARKGSPPSHPHTITKDRSTVWRT